MSVNYPFVVVDVFTETAYGGNQLAVILDARGLNERQMQSIAREFNFAESTFVLPPDDPAHTARVRIFTPRAEMPFAGHPTVGTAAVLMARHAGLSGTSMTLEEIVGPIEVTVAPHGRGYSSKLLLKPSVEVPPDRLDPAVVARVLALPSDAVQEAWFASVGARFAIARLASSELVDAAVLDRAQWQQQLAHAWSPHVFFFAGDPRKDRSLYARMFAPALGIDEDPATGSAVAALAASLAAREAECELVLHVRQGVQLGRPSDIHAHAASRGGALLRVELVGTSVIVAEGVIEAPRS